MFRKVIALALLCCLPVSIAFAQEIRRGTVKSLDIEQMRIVITADGADHEFRLSEETRVLDTNVPTLAKRLQGIAAGTKIQFRPTPDGRELQAIRKVPPLDAPGRQRRLSDTSALKPLTEMAKEKYQGFEGGLYLQRQNARPDSHESAGLAFAKRIQPLNKDGLPDANGQIVLLSIGMSNTSQSSQGFARALSKAENKNPRLVFVNGAQGGMTAAIIQSEEGRGRDYWANVDRVLQQALLTREQVQVVWIKQADAGPQSGFPEYAQTLQAELTRIVQFVSTRFPNCRLAYLSSRTYGGFATTGLNPEPYAYESGFAVKWLIEQQISGDPELNFDPAKGPVRAPWLSWGPYLWANGNTPRSDGFSYDAGDFGDDGTHQSPRGQQKVGKLLLEFFQTDTTTKSWFNSTN